MSTTVPTLGFTRSDADARTKRRLGARRGMVDKAATLFCVTATAIGLCFLAAILFTLLQRGLVAMDLTIFSAEFAPTRYRDDSLPRGGLLHAITGSLIQVGIATAVGTPIGLLVGTCLAGYSARTALGNAVRFVSDILLPAPSILIGLFIYQIVVLPMGGFSSIAGALALAIIVIPVVVRTTEDMLQRIPNTLREAVITLGAPAWKMVVLVCCKTALSGLVTGVLLLDILARILLRKRI
jgi:phosphate transport system permease protein